jgi:hypothetical protein
MTDHSDQRDKIIARLAGQSLRAGTKVGSACPDPELLAAYADHSLTADETRECEAHFAACPKCQKLIALLAVSANETPSQQQGELRDKSLVPSSSLEVAPRTGQSPAKQSHWVKHWLVPVLGAAAVLTLWLVLRPALTPPPTQTSEVARTAAPTAPSPNSPAASAPPQNEIAQAEIPPAPATTATAPKQREASPESDRETARDLDQLKPQAEKDNPRAQTAPQPSSQSPEQPADANPASVSADIPAKAPAASAPPAAPVPKATAQSLITVTTEVPVLETERTARSTDATSAARTAGPVAGQLGGAAGAPSSFNSQTVAGLAKEAAPGVTFAAGDGPMWRVGPAGNIERSNDKGTTWQPQASSVKADLLAGTAASAEVAWVVGREGVILRTTDGQTWQRVPPPNRLMVDWTNIQATDADHASIKSNDNRSFRTEDGGHTWTAQ